MPSAVKNKPALLGVERSKHMKGNSKCRRLAAQPGKVLVLTEEEGEQSGGNGDLAEVLGERTGR